MDNLLYISLENLLRVTLSVPLLYFAIIGLIRISGKRSTSQMNNFDWIVTVAMGSLVASGIVLKNVAVFEVWIAISFLLLLQYLVTKSVLYSDTVSGLVKAKPRLLVHDGQFIHEAMKIERIAENEIYAAIRDKGFHSLDQVKAVILETDANLSILPRPDEKPP